MVGLVVEGLVVDVRSGAEDCADQGAEERQGCDEGAPAADFVEDDRDAAQLHVQYAVAETRVQRYQEADGRHQQLHRPDQELFCQFLDGDVPFLEFGVQCPVSGFVAEATGLVNEQFGRIGFVNEDHAEGEEDNLQNTSEVLGPAPAKGGLDHEGGGYDGSWFN